MFRLTSRPNNLRKAHSAAGFFVFLVLALGLVLPQTALAANPWITTGSLHTGRRQHTATLLPNGKILVVGGRDSSGIGSYLASAELYDPNTKAWVYTSSLGEHPIASHTATLLASGKVLVAGGVNNTGEQSGCYLYNQDTGWSQIASLLTARTDHTATLLPDGRVLVVGGANMNSNPHYLDSSEIYDPNLPTPTWQDGGSLAVARQSHTATLLLNGQVLVAGGLNNNYAAEASAEIYNGSDWASAGQLTARYWHTATLLSDGRVLVAGGRDNGPLDSAEIYNGSGWAPTAFLHNARQYHTANLLSNGQVLVAGGYDGSHYLQGAELFVPQGGGSWQTTGSLNIARYSHTATRLPDGRVLAAGGYDGTDFASAELYAPGRAGVGARMLLLQD